MITNCLSKIIKFLILAGILALSSSTFAGVKTNLELMEIELINKVIYSIDSLNFAEKSLSIISTRQGTTEKWWKANLREALITKGYSVYERDDNNQNVNLLVLEQFNTSVNYATESRNLLLKTSEFKREVALSYSYYIQDSSNKILKQTNRDLILEDKIKASEVKSVENQFYPFTLGTKSESKFIKRLVEPFLVTISTVGVVLLFYSLRSGAK